MALLEITVQPTEATSHLRTTLTLDGARVNLRFYTLSIDDRWCFDITNDDESEVVRGVGLVAGIDLLEPYRHFASFPTGQLFVHAKDGADPDRLAFFEGRASLYYLEAAT